MYRSSASAQLLSCCLVLLVALPLIRAECLTGDDDAVRRPVSKKAYGNLYRGEQTFTLNMLAAINQTAPQENVFFSPYSTYHALLLAYFGAQGKTEQELRSVLLLDWAASKYEVFQAYRHEKTVRRLRFRDSTDVTFRSVDKVYVSQSAKYEPCMQEIFADEFETLDFQTQPEISRLHINEFIANHTDNQIKDVLREGQITHATNLVLANAAFFKADWQSQFDAKNTQLEIFYATPEKREFVSMMSRTGMYNHAVNERLGCHVLELPYAGNDTQMSMVILLPPNMPEALEGVISRLTPDALEQALGEGMSREVELKLPKFSFEKTYQLVSILESMGIHELFQANANLTGFSDAPLQLDDAVHKAKIQVDEEGSTAAAATVVFSFRSSRPLEPAQFFCDHPFMFLIYDYRSSAVLFTGIYRGDNK